MNHAQRDLLERLHLAGIKLKIKGDCLTYQGPKGTLTPELRAALIEWKPDLVLEYNERCGILEYDARLPSDKAEQMAAAHFEWETL